MKKLSWSTIKSIVKSYRLGSYLREFSIVAGGVLFTFWGSNMINENARQKEVHETMLLVIKELKYNQNSLEKIINLTDKDVYMSSLLIQNNLDITSIPKDTLYKYPKLFSNLSSLEYRKDALEVLKGSSLMQYISNKQMLQEILQTYYQLEQEQENIDSYYTLKKDILYETALSKNKAEILMNKNTELYNQVLYLMNKPRFLTFITIVPSFLDWEELEELNRQLKEQIKTLENYYSASI